MKKYISAPTAVVVVLSVLYTRWQKIVFNQFLKRVAVFMRTSVLGAKTPAQPSWRQNTPQPTPRANAPLPVA
jgi:hypothetical protein